MGTMEKAGIVVVGVLITIIVVVGFLHDDGSGDQGSAAKLAGNSSDSIAKQDEGEDRPPKRNIIFDENSDTEKDDAESRDDNRKNENDSDSEDNSPRGKGSEFERESNNSDSATEGDREKDDSSRRSDGGDSKTKSDPKRGPDSGPKVVSGTWPKKHTIVSGDLLGNISKRYYGTTAGVSAILKANPSVDAKRLRLGKELTIPRPSENWNATAGGGKGRPKSGPRQPKGTETAPVSAGGRPSFITAAYLRSHGVSVSEKSSSKTRKGGRTYRVKAGDSLSSIAKSQLGSTKHTEALKKANSDLVKDPNRLREGWVLTLPDLN